MSDLQRANELDSPDRIREGDRLFVPGGTAEHLVQEGESLSVIAAAYGSSVAKIREANKLVSTRIIAGQRLLVPVGVGESS